MFKDLMKSVEQTTCEFLNGLKSSDNSYRLFDNGHELTIVQHCPGTNPADIKVWLEREENDSLAYLKAEAKTVVGEETYGFFVKVSLGQRHINNIKYSCKDGIFKVDVKFDIQDLDKITIEKC